MSMPGSGSKAMETCCRAAYSPTCRRPSTSQAIASDRSTPAGSRPDQSETQSLPNSAAESTAYL